MSRRAARVAYYIAALITLASGILVGCQRIQPVYEVKHHPLPMAAQTLTLHQIENNIIRAGQMHGWQIEPTGTGELRASTQWRTHSATASIRFDNHFYDIIYQSSVNLLEGDGTIHKEYNRRIRSLESEIDKSLYYPIK